ncbi:MAG: DUF6600 domain-containing protein [Candidatus Aminicenantales bacterium]
MKRIMTLAIAAAVLFPFLAFGQSEEYYDRSYTRLSYVQGDVYIQRAQDLGYEQGEVNLVVVAGDKIGTRDGRAEIQLGRGNVLRLDRDTQIDLAGLPGRDGDPTKIHLLGGSVFFRVRSADREKDLQIHTPDASFYVLEPGLFRVDVRDNRQTDFTALSGRAEAAGGEGSVEVASGETVTAADGLLNGESSGLSARGDDFTSWNESRDGLYARQLEKSYLPSDYAEYENELADNGDWSYEPDYGNVWVPRVYDSGWRPYYNGRWTWYPIIGWTWISYEPWGWCTSHFGRWGWRFGLGWYWIPTHRWGWGPAWVSWYNDYDYIGWSPLSYWNYPCWIYNNRFYGHGHDSWHGDFRDYARSMTVVHRNQLQDRRLSRVALDGKSGIKLDRMSLRSQQPDLRPSLGRDSNLDERARRTLDRGSLRGIGRSFGSQSGRLLSSDPKARNLNKKSESGNLSRGGVILERGDEKTRGSLNPSEGVKKDIKKSDSGSLSRGGVILERGNEKTRGSLSSSEGEKKSAPRRILERAIRPQTDSRTDGKLSRDSQRSLDRGAIKVFPSPSKGNLAGAATKKLSSTREIRPTQKNPTTTSKSDRGTTPRSDSRISLPTSRSASTIRTYSSRLTSGLSRLPSSSRSSSSSYRTWGAPSEDRTRFESRSYGTSSRTYSSPSRSYSSSRPSLSPRSYGSSSRSYSSPSRSSSSRSYSSPSRSSSSSSRSVGSSSRSSSGSSRSSSSPSRSSSSSSSSRSSGGSRSSGSVHRK